MEEYDGISFIDIEFDFLHAFILLYKNIECTY